jgi:hypothetical protein
LLGTARVLKAMSSWKFEIRFYQYFLNWINWPDRRNCSVIREAPHK